MPFEPNPNQVLMMAVINDCYERGVHVSVSTIINTVCLWAVGHGFSYQWLESNGVGQVTSDWEALLTSGTLPEYASQVVTNN